MSDAISSAPGRAADIPPPPALAPIRARRGTLLIFGLARGGTNLCAHIAHRVDGVVSLNESVSRFVEPWRWLPHRTLWIEPDRAMLRPPKPAEGEFELICLNKINYSVVTSPAEWLRLALERDDVFSLVLLRDPRRIDASRRRFVRAHRPQRTRWLDLEQLAREWRELMRITADLLPTGRAAVVLHERLAADENALLDPLGRITGSPWTIARPPTPDSCHKCGGALAPEPRFDWDPNAWLRCAACRTFQEGPGGFNYARTLPIPERQEETSGDAALDILAPSLRAFIGAAGWDTRDGSERAIEAAIAAAAPELRDEVRLDDLLYPY